MPEETSTVATAESADKSTETQKPLSDKAQSDAEFPNSDSSKTQDGAAAETFTQKQVSAIVSRETKQAVVAALKEREDAAALKSAEDQGKFKELYDTAKADLKASNDERDALRELANAHVETTIAAWPDELKALVPAADATTPLQRLAAVRAAEPAAKLIISKPARPGAGPAPQPGGPAMDQQLVEQGRAGTRTTTRGAVG